MTIGAPTVAAMPVEGDALERRAACSGFIEHFEHVAAQCADRAAVSIGEQVVSYRELDRQAEELAAALERLGCREETVVAVCCERSVELVAALLAVMKTNAAFLPLDPRFPVERLKTLVRQSRARVVVSQPRYAPVFDPCGVDVVVAGCAPRGGAAGRARARRAGDPASLAYVIYTSGSTGVPKGVAVARDSFYRYVRWALDYYRFDPDGVSVVHTSTGVDLTLTSLCCPLLLGMRIVLVPDDEGVDGLVRLLASRSESIALVKLTPSHLVLMASAGTAGGATWNCDLLIVGGEQLTAGALRFWERQSPGGRVFNEYGPTEATIGCCVAQVQARDSRADTALPIGTAIRDVTLHLRHPFAMAAPVPGEGELFIGGPCLARGYLNAPAATADRFVPDPYREGERLYRTGDWVKSGDAGLTFAGRRDRQLKINGVRIELGEVEAVLQEYPGVCAAAAASVREADGKDKLVAFISVADPGTRSLECSSLIRWMRGRLVDAAVPSEFYVVDRPTLAVSGKVDPHELVRRRHAWTRVVDRFVPPQNPIEELLASLWRSVLDVDELGIDDSFFALDGNSMKAIQFVYGAKKRGLTLTTRDLFEHETIRRLAQLVAASPDGRAALPPVTSHPFALVDPRDRARMPDDVVDAYPLTMLQAGTVLESTRRDGSGTYHNVNSYHLECDVTPAAIEQSVATATRRHPILRTAYDYVNYREPLQLVYRDAQVPLIVEDISHLSDDEQGRYLSRFIETESRTPFDWTRPPLLRVFVHWRGPRRLQLTLSKHHSILDGWSAATLLAEVATNALAVSRGEPPVDVPLEATFRDAVALERQAMQSAELSDFWKRTLHDAPSHALRSWGDAPRPDTAGGAATARTLSFGADESARLKKLATRAGTPLKSVLLAIHLRVLAQMTGDTDLVTGVVANGRPETADGDKAIGLFINTVPFRLAIDERLTWVEFIQRVFQEERRVFPYQRYPMARIKKDLGWDRLFGSVFYYTHFYVFRQFRSSPHLRCVDSTGFEETEIPFTSAFSLHPLSGEISLRLHFHLDHFSDRQIASVVEYFERAVAAVAMAPERAVLAESLLNDADIGWTAVRREATQPAGEPRPVSALFLARVRQHPDRVALVAGDRPITYAALRCRVERLYGALGHHGIGPGSIVGIYETDPSRAITSMLAVNRAGACFVILDPQWPPARLEEVVSQLELSLVLAGSNMAERVPRAAARVIETTDRQPAYHVPPAPTAHDPDQLAYIVFTSGSTGPPKGVMVSHRNLYHSTAARLDYYQTEYERFLLLSRLTFDSAFAGIWGTLCGGGTLYTLGEDRLLDVGVVSELIRDEAVTHFLAIPSLYRVLLPELTTGADASLRAAILAGEELTRDLVQAHRTQLPAVALYNEYGPSEGTVWATVADLSADSGHGATEPVPIGDAVAHMETFVLDAGMRPTAPGVTGELYLGGAGIARGYYRSPRITAARFVPNPRATSESYGTVLYRTGDMVRRSAGGGLQFVGRSDNQVKVRGFRIELEEIERAFCESFPVRDAIALMHESAPGRKRICVLYAALRNVEEGAALDLQDVRATLGQRLPAYTLPDEIAEVESLPRLPNNKLDRKAAEALRSTRAPQAGIETPSSEVERVLANIWRETLMVQMVGVNQSFFDVGGDSLLANQVALRAERLFGVKIPLNVFYQAPTIAAHAEHLTSRGAALGVDFEQVASVWNRMTD